MKRVSLLLLFTLSASAQSEFYPIKKLLRLNSSEKPVPSVQCDDSLKCAQDLCGPVDKVASASLNDHNFDLFIDPGTMDRSEEIDKLAREAFKKALDEKRKLIQDLKDFLAKPESLKDFSKWEDYEYANLSLALFDSAFDLSIDHEKPLAERVTIEFEDPKDQTPEFSNGVRAYAEDKKNGILSDPLTGLENDLYTEKEALDLVKGYWNKIEEGFRAYQSVLEGDKDLKEKYEKLKTSVEEEQLDPEEMYNLTSDIRYLQYRADFAKDPASKYPSSPSSCRQNCQQSIQKILGQMDFAEKLKKLEELVSDPELLNGELKQCQGQLASYGMKKSNKDAIKKLYPEIKKRFLERAMKGMSEHSKKAFSDYLDGELNLSFDFEGPSSSFDEWMEKLSGKDDSGERVVSGSSLITDLFRELDYFDIDVCDDGMSLAWDSFSDSENSSAGQDIDPSKDNIRVSIMSCTYADVGKQVLSHELGHALSSAFQKNKLSVESKEHFLSVRSCVADDYVHPLQGERTMGFGFPDDTQKVEEDMADYIGYMTFSDEPSLIGCALIDTGVGQDDYIDVTAEVDLEDSHSAPLVRALREAKYKNLSIPSSCQAVMAATADTYRFKVCQ